MTVGQSASPVRQSSSIFGPGMLRWVLATMVFVSHVSRLNIGRIAVVLFFMLSGYWVARLFDQRGKQVRAFLIDRVLRVWPLLAIVAIAIVGLVTLSGREPYGSLWSTLALLGLASRHGDVIGVAWSLDVEMQFYLLLPVAVGAPMLLPPQVRLAVVAVVVAAATVAGALLLQNGFVTVLAYAPVFAAGAAVWYLKYAPDGRWATGSLLVFAALVALTVAVPSLRWVFFGKGMSPWWFDLLQIAICAALVPFVAWNVNQPSTPLDRHVGNLSYPFYLVHFPIVAATATLTASLLANKLMALGLSCAATLLLYALVDRPLERVRKYWSRRRTVTDPA